MKTFTEDDLFDAKKVLAKATARGKFQAYKLIAAHFTNRKLSAVEILDADNDVVEIPASWVKEVI